MSFILDALKKSESERQNRSGAEFSSIPTSVSVPRRRPWLWIVGALLAINLAVLLGILLRPGTSTPATQPAATVPAPVAPDTPRSTAAPEPVPAPGATFEERVATARQQLAEIDPSPAADSSSLPAAAPAPTEAIAEQREPQPPAATQQPTRIPTIDELTLDGSLKLPELRVDMHVYSEDPGRRFVFINMNKYREQGRLDEGPLIREIRPDGVLLEYDGRAFLLPRD